MFGRSFAMRVGVQHRVTQPNGLEWCSVQKCRKCTFGTKTATFVLTKGIFCTFGIYTRSSNVPEAYIRDICTGRCNPGLARPPCRLPARCNHLKPDPSRMPQLLPGVTHLPVPIQLHASPPGNAHAQLTAQAHCAVSWSAPGTLGCCVRIAHSALLVCGQHGCLCCAAAIVGCSTLASSRCCGCCLAQSCHICRSICDTELLDCFFEALNHELLNLLERVWLRYAEQHHRLMVCVARHKSACLCLHEQSQHLEPWKTAMTRKCKLEYDLGSTHALHSCKTQCQ